MWRRTKETPDETQTQIRERYLHIVQQIKQGFTTQRWNAADEATVKLLTFLRQNRSVSVTQSELTELYARWGLTLQQERRYEEAYKQLAEAERLLNMSIEQAQLFAQQQEITLDDEGDSLDVDLMLQALETLAEGMIQRGARGTSAVLEQVIKVADILSNRERQWNARYRLAAYTSGLTDWERLLPMAQDLGRYARGQKSLPALLTAMRFVVEALIGLQRLEEAREAQQFVVDLARFLKDTTLANEQAELARLNAVRPA